MPKKQVFTVVVGSHQREWIFMQQTAVAIGEAGAF
jgi:hypothetical protein